MGALYSFIVHIIGWHFFQRLVKWFSTKMAAVLAIISMILVLLAAFWAGLWVIGQGLDLALGNEFTAIAVQFIPSNFSFCVSTIFSVKLVVTALNWQIKFKEYILHVA
ncbi:hypothetical protein [Endozoicomonas acroporae]|uniref:hypothetical protein n=1 Tax=Endozoicomonas acroporae TaxID=1701104 RepID=UPI003D790450